MRVDGAGSVRRPGIGGRRRADANQHRVGEIVLRHRLQDDFRNVEEEVLRQVYRVNSIRQQVGALQRRHFRVPALDAVAAEDGVVQDAGLDNRYPALRLSEARQQGVGEIKGLGPVGDAVAIEVVAILCPVGEPVQRIHRWSIDAIEGNRRLAHGGTVGNDRRHKAVGRDAAEGVFVAGAIAADRDAEILDRVAAVVEAVVGQQVFQPFPHQMVAGRLDLGACACHAPNADFVEVTVGQRGIGGGGAVTGDIHGGIAGERFVEGNVVGRGIPDQAVDIDGDRLGAAVKDGRHMVPLVGRQGGEFTGAARRQFVAGLGLVAGVRNTGNDTELGDVLAAGAHRQDRPGVVGFEVDPGLHRPRPDTEAGEAPRLRQRQAAVLDGIEGQDPWG